MWRLKLGDIAETLPRFSASQTAHKYHRPVPAVISHGAKLILAAYAVFMAYESLIPSGTVQSIPHLDKVVHAGAYFLFGLLLAVAGRRLSLKTVFVLTFGFGALMELAQGLMNTGRTASIGDLAANGLGAALAIGLCVLSVKIIKRS